MNADLQNLFFKIERLDKLYYEYRVANVDMDNAVKERNNLKNVIVINSGESIKNLLNSRADFKRKIEAAEEIISKYKVVLNETLKLINYEGFTYENRSKSYRFKKVGNTIEFTDITNPDKVIVFD